jgi:ornithine cyclodeaminase/alanine dehydrogenase-like protein (mu-crystallin family)
MADLLVLNASEVRAALPMSQAIAGMKEAFAQRSTGTAPIPLLSRIDAPKRDGVTRFMSARIAYKNALAQNLGTVVAL